MRMASDYRRFICLDHPMVSELFGEPPKTHAEALDGALDTLRRRCVYRSAVPGRHSFDELRSRWRDSSGDERLVLNCIDLACLLVSHLRRGPFDAGEVAVVLGARRGMAGAHAWVLIRRPPLRWIDPKDLVVVQATANALINTYHLYVIFNDRSFLFQETDKFDFLAEQVEQIA